MKGHVDPPKTHWIPFWIVPLTFNGIKLYVDLLAVVWCFKFNSRYITLQAQETDYPLGCRSQVPRKQMIYTNIGTLR